MTTIIYESLSPSVRVRCSFGLTTSVLEIRDPKTRRLPITELGQNAILSRPNVQIRLSRQAKSGQSCAGNIPLCAIDTVVN